mmetsp:Transcript_14889/g.44946  ORF Transcript_14889/g.44946 Transcript_14889/m.44946 type:complete len:483 (+) Transcript_14889:291-1739(+)|eukprot:CAMPEP_0206149708 /NCGR_PEP_ID=MMETSP1473-20131121/37925_1 /ASSEMBLY_ACC=CAM_ASM_001109 /TAXON_ID=1461547 /ORGANISM="Stichococcus sp, Strain RCC1054" /LENGTH=482 /DNA_ID=CAMNT_0053547189 /DNA_START=203 /DNA_END=1651 /DNA_ORIENTATION=-
MATMAARKAKKDELEEKIQELGRSIRATQNAGEELSLLGERADTYLELAELLRSIPAADSERWALTGLDPTHLAMLALKDAQRGAAAAPADDGSFHRRVGEAQMSLEHYESARDEFLSALAIDISDHAARKGADEASRALAADIAGPAMGSAAGEPPVPESPTSPVIATKRARIAAAGSASSDAFECALCMRLLYEPVATPCAHLFCRPCFLRSCDYGNKCPSCRTVLHVGRAIPVLSQLRSFLLAAYPAEYQARTLEERSAAVGDAAEAPIPLFVMAVMLPGERMRLHIFEPRYRLLVRRAMEGSRRLGMAAPAAGGSVAPIAMECEITECQPLADGRFYLELKGLRRFKVGELTEQDGYRVAIPEFIEDEPPEEGSEAEALREVEADVEARADAWVHRIQVIATTRLGGRMTEMLERAGPKPPPGCAGRAEKLGYWVACVLPLSTETQQKVLETRSSLERLRAVQAELERTDSAESCQMM